MKNLSVNYMGLELNSPFIVASSGLTADLNNAAKIEKSGAGALVIKSVFEEQINMEINHISSSGYDNPNMDEYLEAYVRQNTMDLYLEKIKAIKKIVSIPVIGSINCYSPGKWTSFSKEMAATGLDALELNIYDMPLTYNRTSAQIESECLNTISDVVKTVNIPVAVKISSHFTNIPGIVDKIEATGAKAVVMFNRFYTPDIDIWKKSLVSRSPLSHADDYGQTLRWIAIVSSFVRNLDLSATTGIHSPETAVKQLLAGAKTVQICSILYKNGVEYLKEFNEFLSHYMEESGYERVEDLRGILNYANAQVGGSASYERSQFLKSFGEYK